MASKKSIIKWPTLQSRLENALTDEKIALIQLAKSVPLSDTAKKRLEKLTKQKNIGS
jgi:hypothetical protein